MNHTNAYNHIPEAERNNRLIKERFQIAYYQFSYTKIPRIMIRHLAMNVTQILNLFTVKVGVLTHYNPHVILVQSNWDHTKHLQVEFGAHVQA